MHRLQPQHSNYSHLQAWQQRGVSTWPTTYAGIIPGPPVQFCRESQVDWVVYPLTERPGESELLPLATSLLLSMHNCPELTRTRHLGAHTASLRCRAGRLHLCISAGMDKSRPPHHTCLQAHLSLAEGLKPAQRLKLMQLDLIKVLTY